MTTKQNSYNISLFTSKVQNQYMYFIDELYRTSLELLWLHHFQSHRNFGISEGINSLMLTKQQQKKPNIKQERQPRI